MPKRVSLALLSMSALLGLAGHGADAATRSVRISFVTARVIRGGSGMVRASVSNAGARCGGRISSAGQVLRLTEKRAIAGRVAWRFHISGTAYPGRWVVHVACGRSGAASRSFVVRLAAATTEDIAVTNSGFSQDERHRCISYGLALANRSATLDAVDVTVITSFVDGNGQFLASDEQTVGGIPASGSFDVGGGYCLRVSLVVSSLHVVVKETWTQPKRYVRPPVSNIRVFYSMVYPFYLRDVDAQLTNPYGKAIPDTATIFAVFYDASGRIIGGGSDHLRTAVAAHTTVPLSMYADEAGFIRLYDVGSTQVSVDPCQFLHLVPCRDVVD